MVGSSQWEPLAKYSPEAAKKENVEWFGVTVPEFLKLYQAKYGKEEPSYHSAGGYAAGLILQKAIESAGSIDTEKVKAAMDKEDMYTFYGRIKFNTGQTPRPPGRPRNDLHSVAEGEGWQAGQRSPSGRRPPPPRIGLPLSGPLAFNLFRPAIIRPGNGRVHLGEEFIVFSHISASVIDGLLIGFVYGIAAMGLSLIWGVMRVINLAHGATMALGMFCIYLLFTHAGVNPYLGLLLLVVMALIFGVIVYIVSLARVIQAGYLYTLLGTFAVNMIIIGIGTTVFSTSPQNVDFSLGSIDLGPIILQGTRLFAAAASLVMTGALYLFLYFTRPGKAIRAVSDNRAAAELMGIPSSKILALTFGLGTMLAAVAGGLTATFFPFTILSGSTYQLKSFVICVLGGLGNPLGALFGGLILGGLEGIVPIFMPVSWVPVVEFGLFVLVLVVRPTGIMGAK